MNSKDPLNGSAQYVKGVGPKKIKILNHLGIETIRDLLFYFPFRYEDRSHLKAISELKAGSYETIKARVLARGLRRSRRGLTIVEVAVADKTGRLSCIWFNQPYMKDYFKIGTEVFLYGKVDKKTSWQMVNPAYEIISKDEKDAFIHTNRIVPIYPLTSGITQRALRKILYSTLKIYLGLAEESLPAYLRQRYNFMHITAALKNIHFPKSELSLSRARKRLIFEEFFKFQLIMAERRLRAATKLKGIAFKKKKLLAKYLKGLPFKLTKSQEKVIREIEQDMMRPHPMQRLLQGDVGSGKTIVAVYAMLLAVTNGYQAALMVPTEILAEQHYFSLKRLLINLGVKVALLTSGLKTKDKNEIKEEIKKGQIDIIIGTHTLIQKDVNFKKLGLVVIDEQHKFGVAQRENLKKKGVNPDILIMTATPIPRTLAYTIYGDLDSSIIKKLPPGRKPVKTWWVSEKKRKGAYQFIKEQLKLGRQAYIVYPLIEESDMLELRAAKNMYKQLKKDIFPEFRVGLIHGQMKSEDKQLIMRAFKKGNIDVLVSTIVIEVGIDIANASCLIIEHADRFGLSQLHQLRGRIGRGDFESYCILVSKSVNDIARRRLSSISKYNDGFKIAEQDLLLRGPGEFFGKRQHGLPEIKIGNILKDSHLLELARTEAFKLIRKDPDLKNVQHILLRKSLNRLLEENSDGKNLL